MDRTAEAGKTKGGGVCFMINKKWCDPRNISILSLLLASSRTSLLYLLPILSAPGISSIVITSVYIPPQADTSLALPNLHDVLSGYINKHTDAAFIIAGDFNKANLKKVMPNFHKHISCPTRGLNTLDHCYTPLKMPTKPTHYRLLANRIMPPFPHTGIQTKDRWGEGIDVLVLPLWSYATGISWWRRLGHVPGEFIWRQRIHGCSIKFRQHANQTGHWNGNNNNIF